MLVPVCVCVYVYIYMYICYNDLLTWFFWGGATLRGLWDLSSSTRDQTQDTVVKVPSSNPWTPREFWFPNLKQWKQNLPELLCPDVIFIKPLSFLCVWGSTSQCQSKGKKYLMKEKSRSFLSLWLPMSGLLRRNTGGMWGGQIKKRTFKVSESVWQTPTC